MVDKLSKRAIFAPTSKDIDSPTAARLIERYLFCKYRVPIRIISDRDPKFKAHYWKILMQMMNVKQKMSTADHHQTDGQSENVIRTLSNMIRSVVQQGKGDWDLALPELEFEYNRYKHASTGLSPFEVDTGRISHRSHTRSLEECTIKCHTAVEDIERRQRFLTMAKDSLAVARSNQKCYADKKRRDVSF